MIFYYFKADEKELKHFIYHLVNDKMYTNQSLNKIKQYSYHLYKTSNHNDYSYLLSFIKNDEYLKEKYNRIMFEYDIWDKNNLIKDVSEYELPDVSYINEDNFKELYNLIKYKNIDAGLPVQIIEDIKGSENYVNYLENLSMLAGIEFNKENYDFSEIWDNYIYENETDYVLKEFLKFQNKDLDDYISSILKKHKLKQNINNDKSLT